MKSILLTFIFTLSAVAFGQKINNAQSIEVSIAGNCGMCKETIEKAANKPGEAQLVWNKSTKKAQLTYDAVKTNPKEVLQRVAEAGYDNEYFKGNDDAYKKLANCCHYDRDMVKGGADAKKSCCGGKEKSASCGEGEKDKKQGACCGEKGKKESCDSKQ